jgi:hypothetical protein
MAAARHELAAEKAGTTARPVRELAVFRQPMTRMGRPARKASMFSTAPVK